MSITLEDEVLTLTAVMAEPGELCFGHPDEIPGGLAYGDQNAHLWCIACAKHMAECRDETCDHPRAVFAAAASVESPDPKQPHPFEADDDQPSYAPEGGYCRICGWHKAGRLHQLDELKAA